MLLTYSWSRFLAAVYSRMNSSSLSTTSCCWLVIAAEMNGGRSVLSVFPVMTLG